MRCEYCRTRGGENRFHKGTCDNCGAPLYNNDNVEAALVYDGSRWDALLEKFTDVRFATYNAMLQMEWSK